MEEKKVIAVIKKIIPAVVSIIIQKHLDAVEKEMPHEIYSFQPSGTLKKEKKFGLTELIADSRGMVRVGGGSGFIVEPNGLILTNKHVVSEKGAEYIAVLSNGKKYPAEVVSRDPINDVAILRIRAKKLPTVKLGDARELELGQSIVAIGNALGVFRNTVSVGIVSGLSRSISAKDDDDSPSQELRGLIQTDAAINVGNSGGPLVDLKGRAIGINAAIIPDSQNISFAIPINAARRDLEDVKKYGKIRRPYLGLRYIVLDDNLQEKMALGVNYGAYVIPETPNDPGVAPGSPADKAGLKEKDIVLTVNGNKVDTDHPIQDYLEDMEPGGIMHLLVLRGKSKFKTRVLLTERD
jgi:serine protease Do